MNNVQLLEINKVLSNATRLAILEWLKDPESNFPPHKELGHFNDGVCGQFIQEKSGLSQSTISHFLTMMTKSGVLVTTRHGKWTYFKRNKTIITTYFKTLQERI